MYQDVYEYINEKYPCKKWEKENVKRIYFNHTKKVKTYIEFKYRGNEITIQGYSYYVGAAVTSKEWLNQYLESSKSFIDEVTNELVERYDMLKK